MLYGFQDGTEWVIVAADDSAELDQFAASNHPGLTEVDALTLMIDASYQGLGRAYRIPVNGAPPVVEIAKVRAADVQRNMRTSDPDYDDPFNTHSKEERTIREIHGLDKEDRWDYRTDEEKEKDAQRKAAIEDAKSGKGKKTQNMSGESFSPTQSDVGITDVRGVRDKDGKITITDVIAQKGLWDKREAEQPKMVEEPGVYHRVTVINLMGNTAASLRRDFEFSNHPLATVYEGDIRVDGEKVERVKSDPKAPAPKPFSKEDVLSEIDDMVEFWFKTREEAEAAAVVLQDLLVHVGKVAIDAVDEHGEPHNPMRILNTTFKTFYRLDVHEADDAAFDALLAKLPALETDKMIVQRGLFDEDGSKGVWVVSGIKRLAHKIAEALTAVEPLLKTEVYAVNGANERLVPKGVEVVDTEAPREIGPRPWNDRAVEWHAWTDEERAEEIKKNVKGDEFIFAGSHNSLTGSTVFITPKDYFDKNGKPWTDESLPIQHLLPQDFKEQGPGHYVSYARDWNQTSFHVGQRGIRESWMFRIYLNNVEFGV